jgi:hypothetical protein
MTLRPGFPERGGFADRFGEIERRLAAVERSGVQSTIASLFNAENQVQVLDTNYAALATITVDVPAHWDGSMWAYDAKLWFSCTYTPETSLSSSIAQFKIVHPEGESDMIQLTRDDSVRTGCLAFVDLATGLTSAGSQTFEVQGRNTGANDAWDINDRRLLVELTARLP